VPLAKLSERFYQKFGHDLVEELVAWLNQMDTTYRTDLRELNELNFARFDAKLEQRLAEVASAIRTEFRHVTSNLRVELIRWILVCGVGVVTVLGGLMFTLLRYFHP
jgi:hypothetical protein